MELSREQTDSLLILSAMDYGDAISPLGFHLMSVLYAMLCNKNVVDVPVIASGMQSANPTQKKYYIKKYYSTFTSPLFARNPECKYTGNADKPEIINNFSAFVMGFADIGKIPRNIGDITIATEYNADFYRWWCNYKLSNGKSDTNAQCDNADHTHGKNKLIGIVVNITPILKYKFFPIHDPQYFTDSRSKKTRTEYISCTLPASYVINEQYQGVVINISGGKMILIGQAKQSGINMRAVANTPKMLTETLGNILKSPAMNTCVAFPRCRMFSTHSVTELFMLWSICLPEPFKFLAGHSLDMNMSISCNVDAVYDARSHFTDSGETNAKKIIFDKPFVTIIRDNLGRTVFIGLCDGDNVASIPDGENIQE